MNSTIDVNARPRPLAEMAVLTLDRVAAFKGFAFGLSQRFVLASMKVDTTSDLVGLAKRLAHIMAPHVLVRPDQEAWAAVAPGDADQVTVLLGTVAACVAGLQEAGSAPVGGALTHVIWAAADQPDTAVAQRQLVLSSMVPATASDVLTWVVEVANAIASSPDCVSLSTGQLGGLIALMGKLRAVAPGGTNMRHFIRAAHTLGIPYIALPLGIFQFGWGKGARLLWSSETERTSHISASLAKNKPAAAAMLRMAGIPVPEHAPAPTAEAALDVAQRLGFPVVVKPADADHGEGVTAGLATEADVLKAYDLARSVSSNVLVEKHVEGREYRLLVVHGELFWAHERVIAQVIGDGKSTVQQLIDISNLTRRAGSNTGYALVTIGISDELLDMLARQGQTLDSTPAAGQKVVLERAPSIAGGGDVLPVFDVIHPDNAAIAERAARLLRLDIAGIDFLSTDITRSWRDVGGWITEVNSQPQISPLSRPDIYPSLMRRLVTAEGRIPVALVLGGDDMAAMAAAVRARLAGSGICAGVAAISDVTIGREVIGHGTFDAFSAVQALLTDTTVEAVVLFTNGPELVRHGLPFDRFDLLVIADGGMVPAEIRRFLALVRPHLRGEVLSARGDPAIGAISKIIGTGAQRFVHTQADLAAGLCTLLRAKVKASAQAPS